MDPFRMADVMVIVWTLDQDLGWKNSVFADGRRAAAFLQRSTTHLPKQSSPGLLGNVLLPLSALSTSSLIDIPSNCISQCLRYACNRPPLSLYHARQAVA
jgi:hypothetical protein